MIKELTAGNLLKVSFFSIDKKSRGGVKFPLIFNESKGEKKMKMHLILFLLALTILRCQTASVWDKGYPKSGAELKTEEEKKLEFNKYAIYDSNRKVVQLQIDKGSENYYTLGSYSSVIANVSPSTKSYFEELRTANNWMYGALTLLIVGSIALDGSRGKSERLAEDICTGVGIGGIIGIAFWESSIVKDIENQFHQDLNQRIYGTKEHSSLNSKNRLFNLSYRWELK